MRRQDHDHRGQGHAREADQGVDRDRSINIVRRRIDLGREHDRGHCRMIMIRSMMAEKAAKRAGNNLL